MKLIIKKRIIQAALLTGCLVTVIFLSISFHGCELISSDNEFDYKLEVPEEYNMVGKLHNEGLDYVFNAIREAHLENMKNADLNLKNAQVLDYKTIAATATEKFCKEHKSLKESFDVCQAVILKNQINLKSANIEEDALDGFNLKQKELINEISAAMKMKFSKENLKKLKVTIDVINRKALAELSETEAAPIYCASSTAYATYQYWHSNYKKWYFALHYPEILKEYKDSQLNNLSINNGTLRLKSGTEEPWAWMSDTWNSVEGWWEKTNDDFSNWWDNYGEVVMIADGVGAAWGCGEAVVALGPGSLVFGPTGLVVTAAGGIVYGAVSGSSQGIIGCVIYDLINK